jgi:hypothetical protein
MMMIKSIRISHLSLSLFALCTIGHTMSCASRNYTYYLVEPEQNTNPTLKEEDAMQRPFVFGSNTTMKVRWNDGDVITEVDVPMLSSGQRIVIEHGTGNTDVKTIPATTLLPPPPTPADQVLVDAYRARGLRVEENAPDVSIVRARQNLQEAIKAGNYQLALEWVQQVLTRYPSHPEFLRAQGSILLMMGEKAKAIEVYGKAEAVESDPAVRKKLGELQSQQ